MFEKDIANSMARRFSPNAFPYNRYRNFVNICGIKLVSTGAICGSSTLGCCGDDSSRLANCNMTSVNAAYNALPQDADHRLARGHAERQQLVELGRHDDALLGRQHRRRRARRCTRAATASTSSPTSTAPARAPAAAPTPTAPAPTGTVYAEVNSCGNPTTTDGKWDMWMGYNATGATGVQSTFENSRYVGTGQYRPSDNSMMNSLFCGGIRRTARNTAYNSVSREQMVMSIWKRDHTRSTRPSRRRAR